MDTKTTEQSQEPGDSIHLNTATWALMSLSAQMGLVDQLGLDNKSDPFNESRYTGYCRQLDVAEKKRDKAFQSLVILDAIIIVLSLGQSIELPGGISLNNFPAAIEITTFLATISFYFATTAFFDWHIYNMLATQFNIRKVAYSGIDPDFLSAADKFVNFNLKFTQEKLNIWGKDFFMPGKGAKRFYKFNLVLMLTILVCFPAAHALATYLALMTGNTIQSYFWSWTYMGTIIGLNGLIVALIVGHMWSWEYKMLANMPPLARSPLANDFNQHG